MLSGVETSYKVASMKATSGWTWFAITVQEIYANTILTFYASHDSYVAPFATDGLSAKVETVTLTGFYTDPLPTDKPQLKIYFGCRRNSDLVCYRAMIGYFYQMKIWQDQALKPINLAPEVSTACGSAGCLVCPVAGSCLSSKSTLIFEVDLE